ncbi:MAG: dihydropteroate synthase [Chloroflexota bacterium]
MVQTTISSKTRTVVISPDHPFTIIGERINPTGRKLLASEMAAGNYDRVAQDALSQVEAGAHILDINAGIPLADEPTILAEAIRIVQSITDVPLSIDSSVVAALEKGLDAYEGKALVNSVTGEEERLEAILPLVKAKGAAVIGISNDERGISEDPDVRLAIAKKIVQRAMDHGIPKDDVIIDPLVMPIGAVRYAGRQVFHIVRRCQEDLGVNTCCGASNVSFGLPNRPPLNATFLSMAIGAGLTAAITNPLESEIRQAIMGANVMMGNDENCAAWIRANRKEAAEANGAETRRRKRRRRRE